MKTFTANVIQYLMPHGRSKKVTTELPIESKPIYDAMISAGYSFEAEMLQTEEVSVTISEDCDDSADIDCEVIPNDSGVQVAMIEMLKRKQWE